MKSQPAPTAEVAAPEAGDAGKAVPATRSGEFRAERRRGPRAAVELDVSFYSEARYIAGFTENVSRDGAFVATHLVQKPGTLVQVTLHLEGCAVGGVAEVRWTREASERSDQPPGMGLRFVVVEPGGMEPLEELIARRGRSWGSGSPQAG